MKLCIHDRREVILAEILHTMHCRRFGKKNTLNSNNSPKGASAFRYRTTPTDFDLKSRLFLENENATRLYGAY